MFKKVAFALIFAFILSVTVMGKEIYKIGQSTMTFLKINPSPKFSGMGEAGVVNAFGLDGIYMNPAGIAWQEAKEGTKMNVMFSDVEYFAETRLNYFAASYSLGDMGTCGLGFTYFDLGDVEITDETHLSGVGKNIDLGDYALSLSYSRMMTDRLSVGGTVKYVSSKLGDITGNGFALDIATLYYTGFKSLRVGMGMFNYGAKVEYEKESSHMPLTFRIGVAYDFEINSDNKITAEIDYVDPNDYSFYINNGVEYSYKNMVYARAGYKANYDDLGLTFGLGGKFKLSSYTIGADMSYELKDDLDNVIKASVNFGF